MKKTLFGTFLGMLTLAGIILLPNLVDAKVTPGDMGGRITDKTDPIPMGNKDDSTNNNSSLITDWGDNGERSEIEYDNMLSNTKSTNSQLLTTIKSAIKWILRILATVAVAICLYAGFVMMTSAGDENKYKNGMKILKYAAIGLAIILLSWLIVSVVFWFVNLNGASGVMDSSK